MKMKIVIILFFMISDLYSQNKNVDLYNNITNKVDVKLSSIAYKVKYIQLETNNDCLLGEELQIYYCTSDIFIGDQKNGKYYRFDKDGNFINRIGNLGNGPTEYLNSMFFYVDEVNQLIHVISTQARCITIYNYSGEFVDKLKLSQTPWNLIVKGDFYVSYNNRFNRIKSDQNVKELFVFDKNGKLIRSIPTTITDRNLDMILFEFPFFYRYNNSLFYKNPLNSIVYEVTDKWQLKPVYEINLGPNKRKESDYKDLDRYAQQISVRSIFENDLFLIITYIYKNDFSYLLVDKALDKVINLGVDSSGFVEDVLNGPVFKPYYLSNGCNNVLISILNSERIEREEMRFKNVTNSISKLSKRKFDDNPIIVVAELK